MFFQVCSFILILGLSFKLTAADIDDVKQIQMASEYFQVKNYSSARDIYQTLLQQNLPSWKRAVVMYNLGCTQLADKQWDQAIKAFNAISLDNPLKPLLEYQIKRNLMLLQIRKAESLKDASSIELLRKAIDESAPAQVTYCNLEHAEGQDPCRRSEDIQLLKDVALVDLAKILQSSQDKRINDSSLHDGLPMLLSGVTEANTNADFLAKISSKDDLREDYQNLFLHEGQRWMPLWNVIKKRIDTNKKDPDLEKRQELLGSAKQNFEEGLNQIQQNQLEKAHQWLESSASDLKKLIAMPPPPAASEEKLPKEENQTQKQNQPAQQIDKVLQQLLEMEKADETPHPSQSLNKEVKYPW